MAAGNIVVLHRDERVPRGARELTEGAGPKLRAGLKPAPVLGLRLADPVRPSGTAAMTFGEEDTLLAFSDGLVEARGWYDELTG